MSFQVVLTQLYRSLMEHEAGELETREEARMGVQSICESNDEGLVAEVGEGRK